MKKTITFLILILFGIHSGFAQDDNLQLLQRNVRKNFTWAIQPYSGNYQQYFTRFFNEKELSYPARINHIPIDNSYLNKKASSISLKLNANKIPQQMFYKLFSINDQFTLDNISDLAKKNMTDAEVIQFSATSIGVKGSAERQYFYNVLSNNLICNVQVRDVHTQNEEYDRIDKSNRRRERSEASNKNIKPANKYKFRPVVRNKTGYLCKVDLTMYKIALDTEERIAKFEKAIFKDNASDQEKLDAIMIYQYPISSTNISTTTTAIAIEDKETDKNKNLGKEYFLNKLFAFKNMRNEIAKMLITDKSFVTKESIYNTENGIQAKIGTKEDLETNMRFLVYEQIIDKKGKKKAKKVGAVRVKGKPANNRGIASGNDKPSNFYQIQGKKINKGMMLVEKNFNKSIGFGYGNGFFNLEASYLPNIATSTAIFAKMQTGLVPYNINHEETEVRLLYLIAGVQKNLHFSRNFYLQLSGAIGYEFAHFTEEYNNYNEYYQIKPEDSNLENLGQSNIGFVVGTKLGMYISSGVNIYAGIENTSFTYPDESIFSKKQIPLDRHATRLQFGINLEFK